MRKWITYMVCLCALAACREYRPSDDPSLRLTFSCDTLRFDTVFTEQGSATMQLMVYNRNAEALVIDHVGLTVGATFRVNVDGEQQLTRLDHLQVNGGDSLFVFVRADLDLNHENLPVLVSDLLWFHLTTGVTQSVVLEAYGQDVIRLGHSGGRWTTDTYHFQADKPYLLFDTIIVEGPVTIDPGATLYMHNGACLMALDDVTALGSRAQPITIRGDRIDRLFDSVPYLYASGSWNGLYLLSDKAEAHYDLSYVDILSGNVGVYCASDRTTALPYMRMDGCRIHNHALYGLILIHADALVTNTEISNCASYCVYCDGGKQDFVHTTVASFYGYTNIRIHATPKDSTVAVCINNMRSDEPRTRTSFTNSIITGYYLRDQLLIAMPPENDYLGYFLGNYLKTDSLPQSFGANNTYWQQSDSLPLFRNDYYKYKEYTYYDFRLDSLSPAIGIADSLAALPYPTDRNGNSRALVAPDAGCYQHD